jgi:hypothetical protein
MEEVCRKSLLLNSEKSAAIFLYLSKLTLGRENSPAALT